MKKRLRNKADTVAKLKNTACDLLISQGILNLSIQPILEKSGLSKGALFHHFPTKNHLIAAAYSDLLKEASDELSLIGQALQDGRICQKEFVQRVHDIFCSELFLSSMEISISNRTEPELRKLADKAVTEWWATLSRFWMDTFTLPGRSSQQAIQHWIMASNLLRGHAFTSTFREDLGSRTAFCEAFEEMILSSAVISTSNLDRKSSSCNVDHKRFCHPPK